MEGWMEGWMDGWCAVRRGGGIYILQSKGALDFKLDWGDWGGL